MYEYIFSLPCCHLFIDYSIILARIRYAGSIEQLNIERRFGVSVSLKNYPDRSYQLTGPQKSLNLKTNKTNVKWPKTKVSYETIMNDNILSFIFV